MSWIQGIDTSGDTSLISYVRETLETKGDQG